MCKRIDIKTDFGTIKVADIKAAAIENIAQNAHLCPDIQSILIFGSSLTEVCEPSSDIDIAIVSNKSAAALSKSAAFRNFMTKVYSFDENQEYDRLYFKSEDEIKKSKLGICTEIAEKGRLIYSR